MKIGIIYALGICLFSGYLHAEDFPGGTPSSQEEFEKGFSESKGIQADDHSMVNADRLKMGGYLQAEWQDYLLENSTQNDFITSPMTLELYLDAQLKDDVRAFFKGRLVNDASVDETVPSPFTGTLRKQSTSYLDEMKISFNTQHKVFWTIGRQKVKWGASKFWNPTDFLNLQKRDFLRQDDLRTGISMVKAHIPWKDANVYLIGVNEGASESSQAGVASRVEIPFKTAELSLSSYSRKGQKTKLGSDVSFAVKDFDLYAEAAQSDQATDKNASGGFSYEFKYSDEDTASVGLEGYWQENGVDDTSAYSRLITSNRFIPFNVGKSYMLASLYLLKPGSWNNSTVMVYAIQNASDRSQYYRVTWIYNGMSDLQWTVAVGGRQGEAGTEMKLFNQTYDGWVQMRVPF